MDALKKDRLSADDFGAIYDSKGELGNADEDDYWYDNKGNRISGMEYRALKGRKLKSISGNLIREKLKSTLGQC